MEDADIHDLKHQVINFEKARNNLLAVLVLTVINLILTFFSADIYFLFSAIFPQIIFEIFNNIYIETGDNNSYITGCVASILLTIPYFVFWIFSRTKRVMILFTLVFFGIDCIILLLLILLSGFEFSFLLNVGFHVWILYYLIIGVKAWSKLSDVDKEGYNLLLNEVKSNRVFIKKEKNNEPPIDNEENEQ